MNAEQFRAALDALGLKQTGKHGADSFLGVSDVTIRRWARDEAQTRGGEIPDSVAMLLTLMIARKIKPTRARQLMENLPTILQWAEEQGATRAKRGAA